MHPAAPSTGGASAAVSAHPGGHLMAAAALVALAVTLWRFAMPLSGITGTYGALVTILGEAALVVAGLATARMARGAGRVTFLVLAWIGLPLTLLAAALLHGWASGPALAIAAAGLVIETFTRGAPRRIGA